MFIAIDNRYIILSSYLPQTFVTKIDSLIIVDRFLENLSTLSYSCFQDGYHYKIQDDQETLQGVHLSILTSLCSHWSSLAGAWLRAGPGGLPGVRKGESGGWGSSGKG